MFKVLIIDDESIIAKGLQTKIDWSKLGCTVCGIAGDGLEGQRLVEELKPDIVISDIIMPGITGLELSRYIYYNYPSIFTIILTAYDDFKYAQQAIKFGVKDYILKPIDKNEIFRAVREAVASLKASQTYQSDVNRLQDIVTEVKPIMTSTLLLNIALNGNSEIEALGAKLPYFDLNIGKVAIMVFELEPEQGKELNRLHSFALKNAILTTFEQSGYKCDLKEKDASLTALVHFNDGLISSVITGRLKDIGSDVQRQLLESAGLLVSAGIGKVSRSIYEIHDSYREAREALRMRFFENKAGVFVVETGQQQTRPKLEYMNLSELYQKAGEGDVEQTLQTFRSLFQSLKQTGDMKAVLSTASDIIRHLNGLIYANNGAVPEKRVLERAEDLHSFEAVCRYVERALEYACNQMAQKTASGGSTIICRVEKLVREHYGDKSFSLQSAADELDLSLSYLSRLFKKERELKFMDYLTDVRICEAQKLLLMTDMKNSQIADKVGFYDMGYFSQVFRKKCGMTPSEYRQTASGSGQKIKHV